MEGYDSAGKWLSIARPLDVAGLVAIAIAAGLAGVVVGDKLMSRRVTTTDG